jgi:Holliday junction resolvase RusA-like endonuclease
MKRIQFTVHGKVVGKGRPHFVKKTGVAITPQKTRSYESVIRDYALKEMGGMDPWGFPIRVVVVASFDIPKSWNKVKREAATKQLIPPYKPDIDNVLKIVLDACNRVVYVDDTQVVHAAAFKVFANEPKLTIIIEEADELPEFLTEGLCSTHQSKH